MADGLYEEVGDDIVRILAKLMLSEGPNERAKLIRRDANEKN